MPKGGKPRSSLRCRALGNPPARNLARRGSSSPRERDAVEWATLLFSSLPAVFSSHRTPFEGEAKTALVSRRGGGLLTACLFCVPSSGSGRRNEKLTLTLSLRVRCRPPRGEELCPRPNTAGSTVAPWSNKAVTTRCLLVSLAAGRTGRKAAGDSLTDRTGSTVQPL